MYHRKGHTAHTDGLERHIYSYFIYLWILIYLPSHHCTLKVGIASFVLHIEYILLNVTEKNCMLKVQVLLMSHSNLVFQCRSLLFVQHYYFFFFFLGDLDFCKIHSPKMYLYMASVLS